MTSAPRLSQAEVAAFLADRYGDVDELEPLGGGFWSAAYAFSAQGRQLVIRFGTEPSWYEADRAARSFDSPDLPVPEVLEIGEALGVVFAVSERRYGGYLESVSPAQAETSGPMLCRLLEGLFLVPKSSDLPVDWYGPDAGSQPSWRQWVMNALVDDPDRPAHGWRAQLEVDPHLGPLLSACERRIAELLDACPERRDLVHSDLLHGNVLVTEDASRVTAVFSWKCSARGDFLYDTAWCTFWGAIHPGVAAADPWRRVLTSEVIAAESGALTDAAARHHCYELQIGASHLGWNTWVGDAAALAQNAELLAEVLERGPLPVPNQLSGSPAATSLPRDR
jgi:aminoglycoside phosphotransferase (APT) family kinase protein